MDAGQKQWNKIHKKLMFELFSLFSIQFSKYVKVNSGLLSLAFVVSLILDFDRFLLYKNPHANRSYRIKLLFCNVGGVLKVIKSIFVEILRNRKYLFEYPHDLSIFSLKI